MIEKMRKEGKLDPPPAAVVATRHRPSLALPNPPKSMGEELIVLQGADIGWHEDNDDGDSEARPILRNIDLSVNRGMKLILRG